VTESPSRPILQFPRTQAPDFSHSQKVPRLPLRQELNGRSRRTTQSTRSCTFRFSNESASNAGLPESRPEKRLRQRKGCQAVELKVQNAAASHRLKTQNNRRRDFAAVWAWGAPSSGIRALVSPSSRWCCQTPFYLGPRARTGSVPAGSVVAFGCRCVAFDRGRRSCLPQRMRSGPTNSGEKTGGARRLFPEIHRAKHRRSVGDHRGAHGPVTPTCRPDQARFHPSKARTHEGLSRAPRPFGRAPAWPILAGRNNDSEFDMTRRVFLGADGGGAALASAADGWVNSSMARASPVGAPREPEFLDRCDGNLPPGPISHLLYTAGDGAVFSATSSWKWRYRTRRVSASGVYFPHRPTRNPAPR